MRKRTRFEAEMLVAMLWACVSTPTGPPEGVLPLEIRQANTHWVASDFHPVAPPVPLPAPGENGDVVVWIFLPPGGVVRREGGSLRWPPGTVADRVERRERSGTLGVVDVRGTRLDAQGRAWDHLLRPAIVDGEELLLGAEWPAQDGEARTRAVAWLTQTLQPLPPVAAYSATKQESWAASLQRKSACDRCHQPNLADALTRNDHPPVRRGTDASGWFTPQTLLRDAAPSESYGHEVVDPFVHRECPAGASTLADGACAGGVVATSTYDHVAALAAEDPRAQEVCASRRWLAAHLEASDPAFESASLTRCGIMKPDTTMAP